MSYRRWWIINKPNCSRFSVQEGVKLFSWIQMVLDGFGILLQVIILISNLTSRNYCLQMAIKGMRHLGQFNPSPYYDDRHYEHDTLSEIYCDEASGGIISFGPIIICFHIFSIFISTFLLIGVEQRNIGKCALWIRLAGILMLCELILLIAYMQIHNSNIILFGGFDCAYKIFGIWLVHRYTGDVDGYVGMTSWEEESYEILQANSANSAPVLPAAGDLSLMDYHENFGRYSGLK